MRDLRPRSAWLLAGLLVAFVLTPALLERPRTFGDGGEYLLMTESLYGHASPDLRAEDVASLRAARTEGKVEGDLAPVYRPDRNRRLQAIHFWGYSLLCVPARAILRLLNANAFLAAQITNAVLFLLALLRGGPFSRMEVPSRSLYAALLFLSPVTAFVLWPHPEIFSCSLVVLALALWREGSLSLAVLLAALASVQNPPLALLAGFLWWEAWREQGSLRPTLALLPALWPVTFHLLSFGRLTPLTEVGGVALHNVSAHRVFELFFDLNLGLLPYAPFVLLGALAAPFLQVMGRRPVRPLLALWAVLLAMAVACTVTGNWNHGTAGPSRYLIWLLPLVLEVFTRMLEPGFASPRVRTAFLGLAALAVATQATLLAYRGGIDPTPDHREHSYAARFVLRYAPDLYRPSPEIFVERTLGREIRGDEVPEGAPVVLGDESRCYKVLTQKRHWPEVLARCGRPRHMPDLQRLARERRRNEWFYVDYGAAATLWGLGPRGRPEVPVGELQEEGVGQPRIRVCLGPSGA